MWESSIIDSGIPKGNEFVGVLGMWMEGGNDSTEERFVHVNEIAGYL